MIAFPKPEPRKRAKNRYRRAAGTVIAAVRAECVERDGYCRVALVYSPCEGPSELAHLEPFRRWQTVGMPLAVRHHSSWCIMACQTHHREYDAHAFSIEVPKATGAWGRLTFVKAGWRIEEPLR